MTNEMFNHVANVFLDYLKANLVKKGKEYSPTGNRFHNFELAATEYANQGVRTEDNILLAMQGMRYKHDISVDDIRRAVLHGGIFHGDAGGFMNLIGWNIAHRLHISHTILFVISGRSDHILQGTFCIEATDAFQIAVGNDRDGTVAR